MGEGDGLAFSPCVVTQCLLFLPESLCARLHASCWVTGLHSSSDRGKCACYLGSQRLLLGKEFWLLHLGMCCLGNIW